MSINTTLRFLKKTLVYATSAFAISLAYAGSVFARDFQNFPLDFLFGNHIDTHQETVLVKDKAGNPTSLYGFFYIIYTGDTDPASGLPVARHPRGLASDGSHDERCGITVECMVGWTMSGKPGNAKFLSHSGVNGDDHPVWLVNRSESSSALVSAIPQPGSYTHFHWITSRSTDPRAGTVVPDSPCDQKNAGEIESAGGANKICTGWFLQITALRNFAFEHGGEIIPVRRGDDNRSHLNLVTNYKPLPEGIITRTRGSDGGGH